MDNLTKEIVSLLFVGKDKLLYKIDGYFTYGSSKVSIIAASWQFLSCFLPQFPFVFCCQILPCFLHPQAFRMLFLNPSNWLIRLSFSMSSSEDEEIGF
jgi:hypothetical protein